jgi:hypothetical protein
MGKITIIYTRHEAVGRCNPDELLKLIETIQPSVIFEELSQSNFNRAYVTNELLSLETETIKKYRVQKIIEQIPIDTFPRNRDYDEKVALMHNRIYQRSTQDGFDYRNLLKQLFHYEERYGFEFLNSEYNDQIWSQIDELKLKILAEINDPKLNQIHLSEQNMIYDREKNMLRNIYDFAEHHAFDQAVMFIGSGHRRTLIPLIELFEKEEKINIEWIKSIDLNITQN